MNLANRDDIELYKFGADFYYIDGSDRLTLFRTGDNPNLGYEEIALVFSQSGTSAPTVEVLKNTTNVTLPSWTRGSAGYYTLDVSDFSGSTIFLDGWEERNNSGTYISKEVVTFPGAERAGTIAVSVDTASNLLEVVVANGFDYTLNPPAGKLDEYSTVLGDAKIHIGMKIFS